MYHHVHSVHVQVYIYPLFTRTSPLSVHMIITCNVQIEAVLRPKEQPFHLVKNCSDFVYALLLLSSSVQRGRVRVSGEVHPVVFYL